MQGLFSSYENTTNKSRQLKLGNLQRYFQNSLWDIEQTQAYIRIAKQ